MSNKEDISTFCAHTGKRTKGKRVVLVDYAIQYVREMGYLVTNFKVK